MNQVAGTQFCQDPANSFSLYIYFLSEYPQLQPQNVSAVDRLATQATAATFPIPRGCGFCFTFCFQFCNHVLVITYSTLIKDVLLLAVSICFPGVVPGPEVHADMFLKWRKTNMISPAETFQWHSSTSTSLDPVDSPAAQLRKWDLCLCEGFLRRGQRGTHRDQVLWSQVMTYQKPSSAWPLHSSPHSLQWKMPSSVEEEVHGITQHFSPCARDVGLFNDPHLKLPGPWAITVLYGKCVLNLVVSVLQARTHVLLTSFW